jgi:hypothetical protein
MHTYEFPNQEVNLLQLTDELTAAGIPCLGSGKHSRRRVDGVMVPSDPYIVVRTEELTNSQVTIVNSVVADHIAEAETPLVSSYEAASTTEERLDALAKYLGLS